MARKYDLRRLKQAVSIVEVLAAYRLDKRLRLERGEFVGPCVLPGHQGDRDNKAALRIDPDKGIWNCLTHCGGGDLVELVARLEGGNYSAAARTLARIEAQGSASLPRPLASRHPARSEFVPYAKTLRLDPHHPFLRSRGIEPSTAALFEAGWWPLEGFLHGCIGVRLHDLDGCPLGYAGRRVDPDGARRLRKWKVPARLPKAQLLFNWHRARPHLDRPLVVVEGPFDAMRVWQIGIPSVVALLGTHLSPVQAMRLTTVPEVIVLLDGDPAGRAGAARLSATLGPKRAHRVDLPAGRDPADLPDRDLRRVLLSFFP